MKKSMRSGPRPLRRSRQLLLLLVLACLGASTWGGAANAEPRNRARNRPKAAAKLSEQDKARHAVELNDKGSELYLAGDYAGALTHFERAYALLPEPNLLFNIAGCHEQLGEPKEAFTYYQRFLGEPDADAEGRRRASASMGELASAAAPPPVAVVTAAPPTDLWSHPAWPWVTLGAGVLVTGVGTGLYLDGAEDHRRVTSAASYGDAPLADAVTQVEAQSLIDSGDTKKAIGGLGLGLGSVLILTHVGLRVWQVTRDTTAPTSTVNASLRLVPGGGVLSGSF